MISDSPQTKVIQPIVLTPYKIPDIPHTLTLSPAFCKNSQAINMSPYIPSLAKPRASPFIPFCRENLSPICSVEENFSANNSKRVLFSPM